MASTVASRLREEAGQLRGQATRLREEVATATRYSFLPPDSCTDEEEEEERGWREEERGWREEEGRLCQLPKELMRDLR